MPHFRRNVLEYEMNMGLNGIFELNGRVSDAVELKLNQN